ncbi:hypothetical protein [Butyrivibrio fibrisolvens]|uniref:hypothetical protein n=1 Tax=Butyrivibrio fibrisolvens TaxID=831 RepID=UPI0020BE1E16|nr:hypothetical protein [Butyrivibrio fibrisolvens]
MFRSENRNSEQYTINGFSYREDEPTWTEGNEASLFVYANGFDINAEAKIVLDIADVYNKQSIKLLVNGQEIYQAESVSEGEHIEAVFDFPDTNMITISILLDDAISPFDIGEGRDLRELGIQLEKICIYQ